MSLVSHVCVPDHAEERTVTLDFMVGDHCTVPRGPTVPADGVSAHEAEDTADAAAADAPPAADAAAAAAARAGDGTGPESDDERMQYTNPLNEMELELAFGGAEGKQPPEGLTKM